MEEHWTFDDNELSSNFKDYVKKQLSWYDIANQATKILASHYLEEGGLLYDIGSSSGNIDVAMNEVIKQRNATIICLEKSKIMADNHIGVNMPIVIDALDYKFKQFDVAICFLTLMFISPSKRANFINELRLNKKEGGCIIIVDKFTPLCGYEGLAFLRMTMDAKLNSGETHKDVLTKEIQLIGVQRPLKKSEVGECQTFFKYGDFEGVIITN